MDDDSQSLPLPSFAGGTAAITSTPVVGRPARDFAEAYVPGDEALADGELRVTILGSGNPCYTRAQASGSVLEQLPPTLGVPRVPYTPVMQPPPAWWAEARIPLDDLLASA